MPGRLPRHRDRAYVHRGRTAILHHRKRKASTMKSVLRNRSLALTALATIALSLSACSGAENVESVTSDSASIDDGHSVNTESTQTSEPAASETEQQAPEQEQLTGHSEQA